ncbi:MAG TPA: hypothetical protein VF405_02140 [Gammaproteobacteria bacterium]
MALRSAARLGFAVAAATALFTPAAALAMSLAQFQLLYDLGDGSDEDYIDHLIIVAAKTLRDAGRGNDAERLTDALSDYEDGPGGPRGSLMFNLELGTYKARILYLGGVKDLDYEVELTMQMTIQEDGGITLPARFMEIVRAGQVLNVVVGERLDRFGRAYGPAVAQLMGVFTSAAGIAPAADSETGRAIAQEQERERAAMQQRYALRADPPHVLVGDVGEPLLGKEVTAVGTVSRATRTGNFVNLEFVEAKNTFVACFGYFAFMSLGLKDPSELAGKAVEVRGTVAKTPYYCAGAPLGIEMLQFGDFRAADETTPKLSDEDLQARAAVAARVQASPRPQP